MLNCSITRSRISFSSCSACRHDGKPPRAKLFVQDPALVGADGIAFDETHNLYAAVDRQNTLIRISPEGTITTLATCVWRIAITLRSATGIGLDSDVSIGTRLG
jgi:sugar lactone lactonase YvrE